MKQRERFLGTAHLALGCFSLVAAGGACVTWATPSRPEFSAVAAASRLALLGGLAYLALTSAIHLVLGRRLRQGEGAVATRTILASALAHTLVLGTILKLSLRNPKSPAFLGGAEDLLASLTSIGALAGCLLVFTLWWLQGIGGRRAGRRSAFKWLSAVHFVTSLLAAGALLRLDALPWPE